MHGDLVKRQHEVEAREDSPFSKYSRTWSTQGMGSWLRLLMSLINLQLIS